jgi:hypothetical protein
MKVGFEGRKDLSIHQNWKDKGLFSKQMNWYTSLPRRTRLGLGVAGLVVGSLGLLLENRVTKETANQTLGDVMKDVKKSP